MAKEDIITKVKKGVYRTAANVSRQVKNREGIIGKVADVVEEVVDTGREMHQDIQKSGGYVEAMKRTERSIADSVIDAYDVVYKSIEKDFFTNGEFDQEKAEALLKNKARVVRKHGEKLYERLSKIVSQGADTVKKDYHEYVPTAEELKTKYAGIGAKYSGGLLRENCEACLTFRKKVMRKLPKRAKYRKQILEDIKASASENPEDLRKFYARQVTQEPGAGRYAFDKWEVIDKYLKQKTGKK